MSRTYLKRTYEDYLKVIYTLSNQGEKWITTSQIAHALGVSPSTVTETIQKLAQNGLCNYIPYKGTKLTKMGESIAKVTLSKCRVLERLYHDVLKVELTSDVLAEICVIEHALTVNSLKKICYLLNYPHKCPHGNIIPCNQLCLKNGKCIAEVSL
ncbi:MAG: metal-dependent transcriptional regulator [archaeon GB-1867-035]|nr:metal-dependent transcriptional regulator [Candidatus Culexmicrobium profundum]